MNKKVVTVSILVLVLIGGFLIFYNPKTVSTPTQNNPDISDASQRWESKIDDQASVTVTVTPTMLSEESGEWKFNIVLSTHSVELNQDMTKIAALIDDSGKEYSPVRWEGASAGGHHREGVLIFNKITPSPKSVELRISDMGGVFRNFNWQLK